MTKRISVTRETNTGRHERFRDNKTSKEMSRTELVSEIKKGNYDNYHVRNIGGKDTPVSNPDKSENNNLG